MIVDILTTAVNRPNILEITLSSFTDKVKGIDFKSSTIYLHVDPVPSLKNYEVLENIAKKFFGNVVTKYSIKPHYPTGALWVLQQCSNMKSNLCFFLCDDWEFVKEFHIDSVIKRFNVNEGVKSIAINNDWEHGNTFGNSKGRHKPLERGGFRGTPAFYKVDFIKENLHKLKPIPGEISNLNAVAYNKSTAYSLWLSDKFEYYCKDNGCNWKNETKIPADMLSKCSRYKMCIYCGNFKWRYYCQNLSGKKCEKCDVLCSEKCWEEHCNLFHKEYKEKYKLVNHFPNDKDFNKYHK